MVDQFSIRCGEYNVKEDHEIYRSQESKVEEVVIFNFIHSLSLSLSQWKRSTNLPFSTETSSISVIILKLGQVYFHPQYDPRTVKNNFAIVRTKENFIYQEHIGPTCLPR